MKNSTSHSHLHPITQASQRQHPVANVGPLTQALLMNWQDCFPKPLRRSKAVPALCWTHISTDHRANTVVERLPWWAEPQRSQDCKYISRTSSLTTNYNGKQVYESNYQRGIMKIQNARNVFSPSLFTWQIQCFFSLCLVLFPYLSCYSRVTLGFCQTQKPHARCLLQQDSSHWSYSPHSDPSHSRISTCRLSVPQLSLRSKSVFGVPTTIARFTHQHLHHLILGTLQACGCGVVCVDKVRQKHIPHSSVCSAKAAFHHSPARERLDFSSRALRRGGLVLLLLGLICWLEMGGCSLLVSGRRLAIWAPRGDDWLMWTLRSIVEGV